jgi:23S rRNA (cytidine1920-2'-O)/16S rRNA (cytidine1409-2'-O)-methyltransferase
MRFALLELLCRRNPSTTRAEHHARILCGEIEVEGERVRDPQRLVESGARVVRRPPRRYVSRGGLKLEAILEDWHVEVDGLSFIDAGASTGGFTDCLLQRGASRVCAVEVGANQLAYRLRRDSRVTVLERTNIMAVTPGQLPFRPDAAVADLSLRSLRGAARHVLGLVARGWLIALVKPQYELAAADALAGGVVERPEDRLLALQGLAADLEREAVYVTRVGPSRLPGGAGNIEFFFLLECSPQRRLADLHEQLAALVASATASACDSR